MADKLMGKKPAEPPRLKDALRQTWKAIIRARETGYQFSSKVPLQDIMLCYDIYYYDGTLEEFIDLFRASEKILNGK